jgi:hypothetical protein
MVCGCVYMDGWWVSEALIARKRNEKGNSLVVERRKAKGAPCCPRLFVFVLLWTLLLSFSFALRCAALPWRLRS